MTIYSTNNYRKIWEHFNGPIPKDEEGRSYEIHHIDGNRSNNHIENLQCVSIQEHYDIHFIQCDWGACLKIAEKMQMDPTTLSNLASLSSKKRWADPEYKKKMSAFNKEMGNRPEIKKKRSENAIKLWKDPVYRNKISETKNEPLFKQKMSEIQNSEAVRNKRKITDSSEESKQKRSLGNKLAWARRKEKEKLI